MKKLFFSLIALCAISALSISCQKEIPAVNDPNESSIVLTNDIPSKIIAEINQEATKTQYDDSYNFSWVYNDQIRMPVVKRSSGTISACDNYTFTTTDATGTVVATFIQNGTSSQDLNNFDPNPTNADGQWTNMGYLIYPANIFEKQHDGDYPVVNLPSSLAYSSTPLNGGVVPMIGRKVGDTYKFSTAVGILKVTLANTPSSATAIKLVSTDKPIAGKFAVSNSSTQYDGSNEYIAQVANTSEYSNGGSKTLTLSTSGLTEGSSYEFFFPIPVGNYTKGTLKLEVIGANNEVLLEQRIGKALSIERNCVLSVPALTYHRVWITGSIDNPLLNTVKPSTANTIRVNISTERLTADNYSISDWREGNRYGSSSSNQSLTGLWKDAGNTIKLLTASGNYYLQYIVCSTSSQPNTLKDSQVMVFGSIPFKYMLATDPAMSDPSTIIGTYTTNANCGWHSLETSTMIIETSDDTSMGNVMITSILGQSTKLYGSFNSGVLSVSEDQTWYVDGSSATHRLCDSWDGSFDGSWQLKLAANKDFDLVLGSSWLVNQWFTSSNGTDHYYNTFDCIKQ